VFRADISTRNVIIYTDGPLSLYYTKSGKSVYLLFLYKKNNNVSFVYFYLESQYEKELKHISAE
jgi:hypothetical protein